MFAECTITIHDFLRASKRNCSVWTKVRRLRLLYNSHTSLIQGRKSRVFARGDMIYFCPQLGNMEALRVLRMICLVGITSNAWYSFESLHQTNISVILSYDRIICLLVFYNIIIHIVFYKQFIINMAMIQFESFSSFLLIQQYRYILHKIDPLFFWFIIISLGISLGLCFYAYPDEIGEFFFLMNDKLK